MWPQGLWLDDEQAGVARTFVSGVLGVPSLAPAYPAWPWGEPSEAGTLPVVGREHSGSPGLGLGLHGHTATGCQVPGW